MTTKKELRQLAIEREQKRRDQAAMNACPLSRDEFTAMIEHVSDHIVENGHDSDFSVATAYLKSYNHPVDESLAFLHSKSIKDDWSLLVDGDPYGLFGATSDRTARMPLEEDQLESLIDWLDAEVQNKGCDHDHSLTRSWLQRHNIDPTRTIGALMALGGFCDCEVAMNVEPEGIYP